MKSTFFSLISLLANSTCFGATHTISVTDEAYIGSPHSIVSFLEAKLINKASEVCNSEGTTVDSVASIRMSFESNDVPQRVNQSGVPGGDYMASFITLAMPNAKASAIVICTQDSMYLE